MEIVYPPVGIAHITGQIPDLIADRTATAASMRVACAMQPKAAPHFGTGVVIMTAFALARLFQDHFGKHVTVLFDMLDNAPAQTATIGGIEYILCLSHARDADRSLAETNTEPVRQLAAWAAQRAGIRIRTADLQPDPGTARIPARPRRHLVPAGRLRAACSARPAPAPHPPGMPALRTGRQDRPHRPGSPGPRAHPHLPVRKPRPAGRPTR